MIGNVLSTRYRLLSLLGEGGMATVYEAEDLVLGRRVALKLLREQYASDQAFLERFQREARAAAALSHPNVVTVFDVASENNLHYITMEMVAGRSLKRLIQEEAPLTAARVVDLGMQVCEALHYAHDHGVIHRDVKPHNILVTPEGRAKIADFGIAVALGASSLTQSGYVVGSSQYISPEQARGEPVSAASDLYSAGIVLYEMGTGQLPYQGETPVAVALKHVREAPVPPRELNPRIPESLQGVILRAIAKGPEERFTSGRRMAEALNECLRAGLEATAPQAAIREPVAVRDVHESRSAHPRVPQAPPPAPIFAPREAGEASSNWFVMVLALAAFLAVLGAIPLGIMAYSSGSLGRFLPDFLVRPAPTATLAPTAEPAALPTALPSPTPLPILAPKLVGLTFAAARQQAVAKGFEVVIRGENYSTQYPLASVMSQNPAEGSRVEKGARIEVVVSLGKEMVNVPLVVGDMVAAAQAKLQSAGLEPKVAQEWNDSLPAGMVVSQSRTPNTQVEKGSEVVLTVSKGKEKIAVPAVIGMPDAQAQDAITKAGLGTASPNYQDYTTVAPGAVISQDPKPGTLVDRGTTVFIAVRRMPPSPIAPMPSPSAIPAPTPKRG